jgi:hypothetical protein
MHRFLSIGSVAIATMVFVGGVLVFTGVWVPIEALDRRPVVLLTGIGKSGRIEVPVVNLWQQPGFGRDNQVAARVALPAAGQVDARLVDTVQAAGLTWNEIQVRDARGWVISRFVRE